jgi:glutamate formiminotransferase
MERARVAARRVGERVGEELGLPVLLYGEVGASRRPAFFRRGGPEELARRLRAGDVVCDFGPSRPSETAGAVIVGARKPLVAFNVVLDTDDVTIAAGIATAVRESSGGLAGVQALGLRLASTGRAQVSMNVIDLELAALHEVLARVHAEAAARGAGVESAELVGLLPAAAVLAAAAAPLSLPGLDAGRVVELNLVG